jgi:hypothetical protein
MAVILLQFITIAAMPITAKPIKNIMTAMLTIQSPSPIEKAAWLNKWTLALYIGTLFVVALMTFLSWWAGSHLQDVMQKDADVRIKEADRRAAEALENAGKANERAGIANAEAARANMGLTQSNVEIARLTSEAERAKTERAEADKQIAIATADAARAKEGIANAEARSLEASAEVSRLQVIVANAEQKRAEAERDLLELQERIKPRRLTAKQGAEFVRVLRSLPNGTVDFGHTSGGGDEAFSFARQLLSLFKEAGWTVKNEASISNHLEIAVTGVGILTRGAPPTEPGKPPPAGPLLLTPTLATLHAAFKAIGIEIQFINWHPAEGDTPEVLIGSKPEP